MQSVLPGRHGTCPVLAVLPGRHGLARSAAQGQDHDFTDLCVQAQPASPPTQISTATKGRNEPECCDNFLWICVPGEV